MNVLLFSEIHRPGPGRVRPYPDASHPRSGERERIIRTKNPMSTLFQKNFHFLFFHAFPNVFSRFPPASPPPDQKIFRAGAPISRPSAQTRLSLPQSSHPKRKFCPGENFEIFEIFDNFEEPCAPFLPTVRPALLPLFSRPFPQLTPPTPKPNTPFPPPPAPPSDTHAAPQAPPASSSARSPF